MFIKAVLVSGMALLLCACESEKTVIVEAPLHEKDTLRLQLPNFTSGLSARAFTAEIGMHGLESNLTLSGSIGFDAAKHQLRIDKSQLDPGVYTIDINIWAKASDGSEVRLVFAGHDSVSITADELNSTNLDYSRLKFFDDDQDTVPNIIELAFNTNADSQADKPQFVCASSNAGFLTCLPGIRVGGTILGIPMLSGLQVGIRLNNSDAVEWFGSNGDFTLSNSTHPNSPFLLSVGNSDSSYTCEVSSGVIPQGSLYTIPAILAQDVPPGFSANIGAAYNTNISNIIIICSYTPMEATPVMAEFNQDQFRFNETIWVTLRSMGCNGCHSGMGTGAGKFADFDPATAYYEAQPRINRDNPEQSILVTRVAGGHNCATDCLSDSQDIAQAIVEYLSTGP